MRTVTLVALLLLSFSFLHAQRLLPQSFVDNTYRGGFFRNIDLNDSTLKKKWFTCKYTGVATTFSFFRGGNAIIVSAPVGLQINRRINNNLFAFAGASITPSYVHFDQSFLSADFNKNNQHNTYSKSSGLGFYSRAELGLQYINDERTFSISGSIGIERSSYVMPFYNNRKNAQVISANR